MPKKLIIIGGGSAGCFAAVTAAENGADVTLIEKNPSVGKKILATGNGRCNYCHDKVTYADLFRPEGDEFLSKVMKSFSPEDVLDRFRSLGITPVSKDGYIYPYSEQARAVSDVLKRALAKSGVKLYTDTEVTDIVKKENVFNVICEAESLKQIPSSSLPEVKPHQIPAPTDAALISAESSDTA